MPTTQPLDKDELSDIVEGPIKSIAAFSQVSGSVERKPVASPQPVAIREEASAPNSQRNGIRLKNIKTPTLGLGGKEFVAQSEKPDVPADETVALRSVRTTKYTPKEVSEAWQKFIDRNGGEHLLVNAMRLAFPQQIDGDVFRIAQSEIHLAYIRENLDRLMKFVRNELQNDQIQFRFEEVSQDSPLAWNDRELLKHIIESNPAIGKFIVDLDLHIL